MYSVNPNPPYILSFEKIHHGFGKLTNKHSIRVFLVPMSTSFSLYLGLIHVCSDPIKDQSRETWLVSSDCTRLPQKMSKTCVTTRLPGSVMTFTGLNYWL